MGTDIDPAEYFLLSESEVVLTAERLARRIGERFPDSGLSHAGEAVHGATARTEQRIDELQRPHLILRSLSVLVVAATACLLLWLILGGIDWSLPSTRMRIGEFVGVFEPLLGSVVFITAFLVFLYSWERRWKADEVLEALAELRSLIHVIDMHQLTKDPERACRSGPDTPSSPTRDLTVFQLGRYLDYCTELLSICSKVAALYAQAFSDAKVLRAVDEIETLALGLSTKIWQKLALLHQSSHSPEEAEGEPTG